MADDKRSDEALKHFQSRTAQKDKLGSNVAGKINNGFAPVAAPANPRVLMYACMDDMEHNRPDYFDNHYKFGHVAAIPQMTKYNQICGRRIGTSCMSDSFNQ